MPFLDTNIFLRLILDDHPEFSPKAEAYFERIARREMAVRTSDIVIFETVFTLERSYKLSKDHIQEAILAFLSLPGIILPGKRRYRGVFDYYVRLNLPFADAYHAVLMESLNMSEIATFDEEFDRIPGLKRISL